jgi:hypothetical protein
MGFFSSPAGQQAVGAGIGSLLGLGTSLIGNNQQKKLAEQQARDAKDLADKQIQAQQLAYQTAQLQLQSQKGAGSGTKSNTGLYVGLGVGGAVILGLVVYLAVKK